MNNNHLQLLKVINEGEPITINKVIDIFGWTRYRINKYIDEINQFFSDLNMQLKINYEPRIGLSIKGDLENIELLLADLYYEDDNTSDKRIVQLLSILLNNEEYKTIQELADAMFVSRTTLENVLKDVRSLLKKYKINIIGSKFGIQLDVEEEHKRRLIADIINSYKSKLVAKTNRKEELRVSLKFSNDIKEFINLETINKVADIINNFISQTNLYLTEYEFNSLTIHVSISIDRILKDFVIESNKNKIKLETNTKLLIKKIEKEFEIKLPGFEKEYINIYIKSIQQNNYNKSEYGEKVKLDSNQQLNKLKRLIDNILIDLHPDEELIDDLTIHLKSAINRLKNNISIRNPYLDQIKTNFIQAFETSKKIVFNIEEEFDIEFDEDETAYVAIHIQSFFERNKNRNYRNVILVCSSGYGTSKLLEQRLKKNLGDKINILDTVGINKLKKMNITSELIITTVPIENNSENIVYVSPLLNKNDILKIKDKISRNNHNQTSFISLLSNNFFVVDDKPKKQKEIIKFMIDDLLDFGYVKPGIFESIINREELSSTAMGNFAIPHGEIKYINEPIIYVYINKNGVLWGEEKVKIVFLFLLNKSCKNEMDYIYNFFNEIINSEITLQKLINTTTYKDFINVLKKEV